MKSGLVGQLALEVMSHPTRGAWIEMPQIYGDQHELASRTPHGVRGLKSSQFLLKQKRPASHPTRGAWIEMA